MDEPARCLVIEIKTVAVSCLGTAFPRIDRVEVVR